MIPLLVQDPLTLRLVQAAVTCALVIAILLLAQRYRIPLFREGSLALLRGWLQIVAVGLVLFAAFRGPGWLSPLILLAMIFAATSIAAKRAQLPGVYRATFWGIFGASALLIALMVGLGVIATRPSSLIPIGSMLIANAMNTSSLMLERLQSELDSQRGQIEAALALGASPFQASAPLLQAAVSASLIPRIDTMRSLGIVWIPGLMTGMLLAGGDPLQSALYQFVIVALILGVGALASLSSALLLQPGLFTEAKQLKRFEDPP